MNTAPARDAFVEYLTGYMRFPLAFVEDTAIPNILSGRVHPKHFTNPTHRKLGLDLLREFQTAQEKASFVTKDHVAVRIPRLYPAVTS